MGLAVSTFLVAALIPEFFADRYGASSYGARIPGSQILATLAGVTNIAALTMAVFLIVQPLASKTDLRRDSDVGAARSQLLVWWPYAGAWAFGAIFGAFPGVAGYSIISLVIVLAIASIKTFPSQQSPFDGITRWSLRACVCISVGIGMIFPDRAYAPYQVWPGGWREGVDRLQGLFPHPNTLGWVAALAIAFEILGPKRKDRLLFALLAAVALFLTGSRTASIALAVGLVVSLVISGAARSSAAKSLTLTMGPLLILLGIGVIWLEGISAQSFNGRQATWSAAWDSFLANWISGSGPGAYLSDERSAVAYAHNQFLQSMSELGLVGILALIAHIVLLVRLVRSTAMGSLGIAVLTMWLVMFISENLLRFADPGFVPQIFLFQLCLLVAMSGQPKTCVPVQRAGMMR
ncbi:UNVERIFIED_ORG: hypothetical protein ABIB13_003292 [Arthrobacter sp. UYEF2]